MELIAGGIIAAIVAVIAAWWRGRSAGRTEVEQRHQRETLERANKHAQERQHVEDDINRSGESAADRLRDKWSRD